MSASKPKTGLTPLENEILRFVIIIAFLAFCTAVFIVILWAAWIRRSYPGFISTPQLLVRDRFYLTPRHPALR